MSVLDLSSLLQVAAPEALSPPDPPATPAIDNSTASTADSTSSGSSGSSSDSATLSTSLTPQETVEAALLKANVSPASNGFATAADEAAAALVDLGGASRVTVDDYEDSVPPNLAAASALLSELTANTNDDTGVLSAAYVALSSDDALSLTAA
jgi:hypothetical protein